MRASGFLLIGLLFCGLCSSMVHLAQATADAIVQNESMWIDSLGTLHLFGEVMNTGDSWLRVVRLTGTLRDGGGGLLDVVFAYTLLRFLPPGGVGPFNMIEMDVTKSPLVQSYTLRLEFLVTPPLAQQLSVVNVVASKNSQGWLEVAGEVENHAATPSVNTQVTGTFYDAQGKVAYVQFTFTSPNEIVPGGKNPFKIIVGSDERSNRITRYSLTAESENSRYTSVPETPWPTFLVAVALTLVIFALRRRSQLAS